MQITMEQVQELSDRYEQCGLGDSSSGRFLRSISNEGRMPRGRGVSWLEELIAKGDPGAVAPLIAEIEDLMLRSKRSDTISSLGDILVKVKAGWTLSDHRKSELERLRKQVNDAQPDLEVDAKTGETLTGLSLRKNRSSYHYWSSRPVISKRLDDIFTRWNGERLISPEDWEFVRQNFKGPITDITGDRHPIGSLRWTRAGDPATVMSNPRFDSVGNVIIDVMIPSGVFSVHVQGLLMRAPR